MPIVRVPSPLLQLTGGATTVTVEASDVRGVLHALDAQHPGVVERLLDEDGRLHRFVHVFVRDEDVRTQQGLDTPVGDDDAVAIVPAVAGGAGATTPKSEVTVCCPSHAAARARPRTVRSARAPGR